MSLCSVTTFQVERLLVLRVKIGNYDLAKKRCRQVLVIIDLLLFIILSPILVIYDNKIHIGIQCFIEIPGELPLLTYFYLAIMAIFVLLPFTVLPALNIKLVLTIRGWSKENAKLINGSTVQSNITPQGRTRHEGKAAFICTLISIYSSICLSPNILWFLLLLSVLFLLSN